MKYVIPLVIAAVLAPLVLAGCAPGGGSEDNWTYVGTWANPAYVGNNLSGGPPARIVMTSNGGLTGYDDVAGTRQLFTGTFAMADEWTSGGMHYFKGIAVMGTMGTQFFLMRVRDNNNTLESTSSSAAYPPAIDPAGQYGIFGRQ
jgi:hypothetical protein